MRHDLDIFALGGLGTRGDFCVGKKTFSEGLLAVHAEGGVQMGKVQTDTAAGADAAGRDAFARQPSCHSGAKSLLGRPAGAVIHSFQYDEHQNEESSLCRCFYALGREEICSLLGFQMVTRSGVGCLQWSPVGVSVKGTPYSIVRLHFSERSGQSGPAQPVAPTAADTTVQSAVPMEI